MDCACCRELELSVIVSQNTLLLSADKELQAYLACGNTSFNSLNGTCEFLSCHQTHTIHVVLP